MNLNCTFSLNFIGSYIQLKSIFLYFFNTELIWIQLKLIKPLLKDAKMAKMCIREKLKWGNVNDLLAVRLAICFILFYIYII